MWDTNEGLMNKKHFVYWSDVNSTATNEHNIMMTRSSMSSIIEKKVLHATDKLGFGKHASKTLGYVYSHHLLYLRWCIERDILHSTSISS